MKFLTPFVYIALAITLFFMIISPVNTENQALSQKINENKERLINANKLYDAQGKLKTRNNAISQAERDALLKILPDAVDNVKLILDISEIDTTIVPKNIGVGGEAVGNNSASKAKTISGNNNYGSIQLSFAFTTNYQNVKSFINKLEDSLRIVDITDLKISTSNVVDGASQYNVAIKLNTYWLR